MSDSHSITPPPELIAKWTDNAHLSQPNMGAICHEVATLAARWGADQELEACCEWLINEGHEYEHVALRDARRPRPLSLREKALETLRSMQVEPCWINGINTNAELMSKYDILRRALESLPN
jgi:hypothetical protein